MSTSNLFEGEFSAKAIEARLGAYKGRRKVIVEFEICDGDRKGQRVSYDGKLDPESIKWTKRDMIALGWQGKDVRTFRDDVLAANKLMSITCEIARYVRHDGSERQWTTVRRIGGGGGGSPLEPLTDDQATELNRWFADASELGTRLTSAADDGVPF